MLYIENLTFDKQLMPINLKLNEYKFYNFELQVKQSEYFWKYLMNESSPILGNMFINDFCYSKIEATKIKSFNYQFILLLNDRIFYSTTTTVHSFLKHYINIFNKNAPFTRILEKLKINKDILNKKIKELSNLEKFYIYLIISISIKRKITFINSDIFNINQIDDWNNFELEINKICIENEIMIIMIQKNENKSENSINNRLTISNNMNNINIKKTNLFRDISKIINIMFKFPLLVFITLYFIFFETALILSYSFGHNNFWTYQFIITYLIYAISILAIVVYILWISIMFYRYKGFINNIPIFFRQKIMYLCLHFWIIIISLTVLSNIINLVINFIIFGNIELRFWDSSFYMSLGVIITSIVLTPIWILSFQNDDKIRKFMLRIRFLKNEK